MFVNEIAPEGPRLVVGPIDNDIVLGTMQQKGRTVPVGNSNGLARASATLHPTLSLEGIFQTQSMLGYDMVLHQQNLNNAQMQQQHKGWAHATSPQLSAPHAYPNAIQVLPTGLAYAPGNHYLYPPMTMAPLPGHYTYPSTLFHPLLPMTNPYLAQLPPASYVMSPYTSFPHIAALSVPPPPMGQIMGSNVDMNGNSKGLAVNYPPQSIHSAIPLKPKHGGNAIDDPDVRDSERRRASSNPTDECNLLQPPKKKGKVKRGREAFPKRLYRLINEVEAKDMDEIISWILDGTAFQIHQPDPFLDEIAPLYFCQTNMDSFKRQLSNYGFERLMLSNEEGAYSHTCFRKGRPDLLENIKRLSSITSSAKKGSASNENDDE